MQIAKPGKKACTVLTDDLHHLFPRFAKSRNHLSGSFQSFAAHHTHDRSADSDAFGFWADRERPAEAVPRNLIIFIFRIAIRSITVFDLGFAPSILRPIFCAVWVYVVLFPLSIYFSVFLMAGRPWHLITIFTVGIPIGTLIGEKLVYYTLA